MWVGKTIFNTPASFNEPVSPLGLARIWHLMGMLGVVRNLGEVPK